MKILSCDDHELFRAGLKQALLLLDPDAELLEASSAQEMLALVGSHDDLDLLLLDHGLPDAEGLGLLSTVREQFPAVPVVMISASEEPLLARAALDAGAVGFVPKTATPGVLVGALRLVLAGGVYVPPVALMETGGSVGSKASARERDSRRRRVAAHLTPRQEETLRLMAKGLTNREIAGILGIGATTVKGHVAAILEALEVSNRTEAVMAMVELGLADGDDAP